MESILIITLISFVAFLLLAGFVVMRDFSRLWIKRSREMFRVKQGINYYSEMAVTLVVTLLLAISVSLLKGASTVLVAMVTTDDIATFMTALRGVFSSYTTELQSPKNHLLLFFLNPALKMMAVYLLMGSVRLYFSLINKKAGGECYNEGDVLYFSSLGVLFLIGVEIFCHIQDVKIANMAGNISYLLLDKCSYLIYFLTIEEVLVLRSNKSNLNNAIEKYLVTNHIEKKMLLSGWKMMVLAYGLGLLLSTPCFLGFQWIRDNTALMTTFIIVLSVALFIMKKFFSDSWNLLGTVLFSTTFSMPIHGLVFSSDKSRRLVVIGLIVYGALLVAFGFVYPKQLFMLLSIMSAAACLTVIGIVLAYFLTMGIGYLVACITRGNTTTPTMKKCFTYTGWVLSSLPKAVAVSAFVVTLAFMSITCFPKELKCDDIFANSCVVDANGNCLYVDEEHPHYYVPVRFEELPSFFRKCITAQEDRGFWKQNNLWPNPSNWHGVSFSAFRGRGGSNINAQLCKNITYINADGFPRDMSRKISESVSAYMISQKKTPEQLMELYANIASFDGSFGFRGAAAASLFAFGKPLNQLNNIQQLYLIHTLPRSKYLKTENGLIPYNLVHEDSDGAVKKALLKKAERWLDEGLITKKEYNTLRREELAFVNTRYKSGIPLSTRIMLAKNFKDQPGRHDCSITLENENDLAEAYRLLKTKEVFKKNGSELQVAALVVEAKSGKIIAHFSSSEVLDYANCYTYPIGSIAKPAIVLEMLKSGVPADFTLFDGRVEKRKTPHNSHGWGKRPVSLEAILALSLNAPFANLKDLGLNPKTLYQNLENEYALMNITKDSISACDTYNYPLGLREMRVFDIAQVYQTIFNDGVFIPLSLEQNSDTIVTKRIWAEEHTKVVVNALSKTIENSDGTLNRYKNDLPAGKKFYGKTGTSSKNRDFWTVISDGNIVITSWGSYGKKTGDNMVLGTEKSWGATAAGLFAVLIYNELAKTNHY